MDYLKTGYRYKMYWQQQPRKSAKRLNKSPGRTAFPSNEDQKPLEYRFGIYKKLPGIKPHGYRYGYQRLNSESEQFDRGSMDQVSGYDKMNVGRQQYRIFQGEYESKEDFHGQDQCIVPKFDLGLSRLDRESSDDERVGRNGDPDACQTNDKKPVSRRNDHMVNSNPSRRHYYNGLYGEKEESLDEDDGYGDEEEVSMSRLRVEEGKKMRKSRAGRMSYEWDIGRGGRSNRSKRTRRLNDSEARKMKGSDDSPRRKKEKHIVAGIDIGPDPPLMYKKYIWGRKTRPHNHGNLDMSAELQGYRYRGYASNNAFHPGRYFRANGTVPHRRWPGSFGTASKNAYLSSENVSMKPKVVTIVRQGNRPRNSVKILLNRRSVQSFEQLMGDISEAFGPKWKNNKVRKLYTMKGREVQGISDFFRQDDVFVACSNETVSEEDLQDIFHEMYPDSPYAKNHHRDHERSRKKRHPPVHREVEADKRDSGFGEASEGSNSNRESDQEATQTGHGQGRHEEKRRRDRRDREKRSLSPAKDTARDGPEESPRETARDAFGRTDRGPMDDRERARRRQQKMMESEKRALEDERRRRGLVPLKAQEDPFKRMKEREKEKLEARRRKEQEKKRQLEEEEKERRRKEYEEAEKAARARKAAFEKEEREREERERAEREKEEREKVEKEEQEKNKEKEPEKDKDKDKEKEVDKEKVKDKDNKDSEKPQGKKRQKTKIVRRTKAERQIPNDDPVLSKYELGRTLGDGNFAIVRTSKLKATMQEFAMKVIDKPKLKGKEHMVENEIEIMKDCSHHNIVKLYEEYETPDKLYLVMELVKGGDLFDAITQSVKFGEVDSANMVKDLCHALFYLHSRNIVHRDLKPENLLVHRNKDGTITLKLADFGLAMEVKELIYTVCGTPTYVAPEILSEIGYGLEVDMWAVGVISYILLCGFPPFRSPDRNQTELFEFIKAGAYEFLSPYWDYISNAAKDMIQHLLVVDKKRRFTAVQVLSHPWIIGGGDMSLLMDTSRMEGACRERRKELEIQSKQNLESYTRMKEKRRAKEE